MNKINYLFLSLALVLGLMSNTFADEIPLGFDVSDEDAEMAIKSHNENASDLASIFQEGEERDAHEKLYKLALVMQKGVEHELGLPKNDIYAALAVYLYGAWSASHDGSFIDNKSYATLIEDTRKLYSVTDFAQSYKSLSEKDKQIAYEIYAMTGNWMLVMQMNMKETPNKSAAQALKEAAKIHLDNLGLKPDQVLITEDGHLAFSVDILIRNISPNDEKKVKRAPEVAIASFEV